MVGSYQESSGRYNDIFTVMPNVSFKSIFTVWNSLILTIGINSNYIMTWVF